jgi:mannose-6-phosphate isomerase-like protein (cupin superfamily)
VAPAGIDEAPEPLIQALLEHLRLHALAGRIAAGAREGEVPAELLAAVGGLLEAHVRLEERVLFPLIEERADPERLDALRLPGADAGRREAAEVADLREPAGRGVAWSATSADLNVNVVTWPAGGGVGAHVNAERDVLWVVIEGAGEVAIDGARHRVGAGWGALVPAGAERSMQAGPEGIRYVSAHLRRPPGIALG